MTEEEDGVVFQLVEKDEEGKESNDGGLRTDFVVPSWRAER
jgi:hypothetical protein